MRWFYWIQTVFYRDPSQLFRMIDSNYQRFDLARVDCSTMYIQFCVHVPRYKKNYGPWSLLDSMELLNRSFLGTGLRGKQGLLVLRSRQNIEDPSSSCQEVVTAHYQGHSSSEPGSPVNCRLFTIKFLCSGIEFFLMWARHQMSYSCLID